MTHCRKSTACSRQTCSKARVCAANSARYAVRTRSGCTTIRESSSSPQNTDGSSKGNMASFRSISWNTVTSTSWWANRGSPRVRRSTSSRKSLSKKTTLRGGKPWSQLRQCCCHVGFSDNTRSDRARGRTGPSVPRWLLAGTNCRTRESMIAHPMASCCCRMIHASPADMSWAYSHLLRPARVAAIAHAAAAIHDQPAAKIRFVFKVFRVQPIGSSEGPPINASQIVTGRVGSMFRKLRGETAARIAVHSRDQSRDKTLRPESQSGQPGELRG